MQIDIKVRNMKALRRAFEKSPRLVADELQTGINRAAITIQRIARQEAPVATGRLRSSIRPHLSPLQAIIAPRVKYAMAVHEGSDPRWVPLEQGRGLHRWAVRKGLNPYAVRASIAKKGTQANPFMDRAFNQAEAPVQREMNQVLERITRGLAR